jgi:hypothetical protein
VISDALTIGGVQPPLLIPQLSQSILPLGPVVFVICSVVQAVRNDDCKDRTADGLVAPLGPQVLSTTVIIPVISAERLDSDVLVEGFG